MTGQSNRAAHRNPLRVVPALFCIAHSVLIAVVVSGCGRESPPPVAQQPDTPAVQLHVERQGGDLRVSWDQASPLIASAKSGMLVIADGSAARRELHLSADALHTGSVLYTPLTDNVQLSLELTVMGSSVSVPVKNGTADPRATATEAASLAREPVAGPPTGQSERFRAAAEHSTPDRENVGLATFYLRPAANGTGDDRFTATHTSAPVGTMLRVTNLANSKSVVVRVIGRAPANGRRIISVNDAAARELGFVRTGTARVRVEPVLD